MQDDDARRARAAQWDAMLAAAGTHAAPPRHYRDHSPGTAIYSSQEEVERRGGAREPFARGSQHIFNNYRINSRRSA